MTTLFRDTCDLLVTSGPSRGPLPALTRESPCPEQDSNSRHAHPGRSVRSATVL
jgi:hypothetical protein